ncbi:MAG: hypothetical protein OEQ29_18635 [Alphaproteobacteria bacterium]|nr:hypothetical protein [Alphaproteobacteria bacterium]
MSKHLSSTAVAFALPLFAAVSLFGPPVIAHEQYPQLAKIKAHDIQAKSGNALAAFDIVHAKIVAAKRGLTFQMHVSGRAGSAKPAKSGKLAGSRTFAYVWPTKLGPGAAGFEPKSGILALAVTSHPDFDDTPWFDENGDGKYDNDGDLWHMHWVVLVPDNACGKGMLKVKDIKKGAKPKLPRTWPGLPLYIDSPGYSPRIEGKSVEVRVPFANASELKGIAFDAVTAGLRISKNLHAPLFCVANVFDVASGSLSLPGKVR